MITPRATRLRLVAVFIAMAVAPVVGCGDGVTVHSATSPTTSFEHYRTFSFGTAEGPPRGYRSSSRAPEVQRLLEPLIAAGLTRKGYAFASSKGDLLIDYGFGRRDVVVHESSEYPGGAAVSDDGVEGALVIDAFDATTGARVWHGASRADHDSRHVDDALLRRSATEILAAFPAVQLRADPPSVARIAVP
jgi:hypothetical protein